MRIQEAVQVAALLGVSQQELLERAASGSSPQPKPEPPRRGRPRVSHNLSAPHLVHPDLIPIRATVSDEPIGYTPRPHNLSGVRNAYAIYMAGEQLAPRYEPGWLLHVHPFKPPTCGRDVVVWKKDQTMIITQFVGWDGDMLLLRQLNPRESLRVPHGDIAACHLVVGVDQEG